MSVKKFMVLFLFVFAVGFLVIGGIFFGRSLTDRLRFSGRTEGVVVEYAQKQESVDSSSDMAYAPVVLYRTNDQILCTGVSEDWASGQSFAVGERISVWYDPENPAVVAAEGLDSVSDGRLGFWCCLVGGAAAVFAFLLSGQSNGGQKRGERKGQRMLTGKSAA